MSEEGTFDAMVQVQRINGLPYLPRSEFETDIEDALPSVSVNWRLTEVDWEVARRKGRSAPMICANRNPDWTENTSERDTRTLDNAFVSGLNEGDDATLVFEVVQSCNFSVVMKTDTVIATCSVRLSDLKRDQEVKVKLDLVDFDYPGKDTGEGINPEKIDNNGHIVGRSKVKVEEKKKKSSKKSKSKDKKKKKKKKGDGEETEKEKEKETVKKSSRSSGATITLLLRYLGGFVPNAEGTMDAKYPVTPKVFSYDAFVLFRTGDKEARRQELHQLINNYYMFRKTDRNLPINALRGLILHFWHNSELLSSDKGDLVSLWGPDGLTFKMVCACNNSGEGHFDLMTYLNLWKHITLNDGKDIIYRWQLFRIFSAGIDENIQVDTNALAVSLAENFQYLNLEVDFVHVDRKILVKLLTIFAKKFPSYIKYSFTRREYFLGFTLYPIRDQFKGVLVNGLMECLDEPLILNPVLRHVFTREGLKSMEQRQFYTHMKADVEFVRKSVVDTCYNSGGTLDTRKHDKVLRELWDYLPFDQAKLKASLQFFRLPFKWSTQDFWELTRRILHLRMLFNYLGHHPSATTRIELGGERRSDTGRIVPVHYSLHWFNGMHRIDDDAWNWDIYPQLRAGEKLLLEREHRFNPSPEESMRAAFKRSPPSSEIPEHAHPLHADYLAQVLADEKEVARKKRARSAFNIQEKFKGSPDPRVRKYMDEKFEKFYKNNKEDFNE